MGIANNLRHDMRRTGLELIADPRVSKLMQNEQVLRALMSVAQVPGRVNDFTTEQTDRLAKTLGFATAEEVRDLRRSIKRLERDLARMRSESQPPEAG